MDINQIEMINMVEAAALELASQDRANVKGHGPRVYASYAESLAHAGWHSDCGRSPLPGLLHRDMPREQAEADGYHPTRRGDLSMYVLVATSFDTGYIGRASKVYYSIWGKS